MVGRMVYLFVRVRMCASPARANSNVLVGWSNRYWGIIPTLPSHCSHLCQQDTAGQIRTRQRSAVLHSDSGNGFPCPHKHIHIHFCEATFLPPTTASQFRNSLHETDGMRRDSGPDRARTSLCDPCAWLHQPIAAGQGNIWNSKTCVCERKRCLCAHALCVRPSSLPH